MLAYFWFNIQSFVKLRELVYSLFWNLDSNANGSNIFYTLLQNFAQT